MADAETTEFVQQLTALIDRFKGAVWREAYKAGSDAMRDSILRAAQSPIPPSNVPVTESPDNVTFSGATQRAPRGSVGRAIDALLKEHPGLSIQHMEKIIALHQPEIAQKSIGNELRRMEGRKYKRHPEGGNL